MAKISRLERRINNQRKNWQFNKAKELVREYDLIGVETLDFAQMRQQRPALGVKIHDNQYAAFLKKVKDNADEAGKTLIHVRRYYPSSQICSACNQWVGKLALGERTFHCPYCGTFMQRDLNASKNILQEALRIAG